MSDQQTAAHTVTVYRIGTGNATKAWVICDCGWKSIGVGTLKRAKAERARHLAAAQR